MTEETEDSFRVQVGDRGYVDGRPGVGVVADVSPEGVLVCCPGVGQVRVPPSMFHKMYAGASAVLSVDEP